MTRYYLFLSCLLYVAFNLNAQHDTLSTIVLDELTVTTYGEKRTEESSINISSISIDSLNRFGNFMLSDMIAQTPGVDVLSSGVGISKPVIRGLYGNRILLLLSGLKFDNQQWQEEHGMGLSDFGLEKVEVIKGPMSILYGTEAIGGIINLIEEKKPLEGTTVSDYGIRFHSNTLGGLFQAGIKKNNGKNWWRLRLGFENNADYSDGSNSRVLNSRYNGYYLKSTYGFTKKRWSSTNNYMSSFNKFGFIFNDVYTFIDPDDRWSRSLSENPNHIVFLNVISSENKFKLNNSKLFLDVGVQSNERMENEGGGKISLNMHLLTLQYLAKWERQVGNKNKVIISSLGSIESNTNYGSRKIVPNATMQESNLSVYLESFITDHLTLENGIGIGEKRIHTTYTSTVNDSKSEISPFNKFSTYYTAYSGISYFPSPKFNAKMNIANGVRVPNLAELSSDGLHEGIFTYEIGDPTLQNEQNISVNGLFGYRHSSFSLEVTPFFNLFHNYVYLTPTNEEWYGFPIYRYRQQDAQQYGGEISASIELKNFTLRTTYQKMISETVNGEHLPFTPAQKIKPGIYFKQSTNILLINLFTSAVITQDQYDLAEEEIGTPGYTLINVGGGFTTRNQKYSFSIAANNILNKTYYDHLSRFKYFGLNNIGRNITINFKTQISSSNK